MRGTVLSNHHIHFNFIIATLRVWIIHQYVRGLFSQFTTYPYIIAALRVWIINDTGVHDYATYDESPAVLLLLNEERTWEVKADGVRMVSKQVSE